MQIRLVPIDLLFFSREGVVDDAGESLLLPIVSHDPLMAFYRFLLERTGALESYWRWFNSRQSRREVCREQHVIEWRRRIRRFRWFPYSLKPVISQLTRDCLVVNSGIEQACLAKYFNKRWIRVSMPDTVCELWDSRSTSELQTVLEETSRKKFYNPVFHEQYRSARVSRPDSIRIDRIRRFLGSCGEGLRGLDIGCNMGYMSHMLQRQGFKMTGVDFDEYHVRVANALNRTYRLDVSFVNCRFEDFDVTDEFDVVVMLTVFYHTLNRSEAEAAIMLSKLDELGAAILFWESGDQPQREIKYIRDHCGLTEYLTLGSTMATGKRRELGVFLKPSTPLSHHLRERYKTELLDEFNSSRRHTSSKIKN